MENEANKMIIRSEKLKKKPAPGTDATGEGAGGWVTVRGRVSDIATVCVVTNVTTDLAW